MPSSAPRAVLGGYTPKCPASAWCHPACAGRVRAAASACCAQQQLAPVASGLRSAGGVVTPSSHPAAGGWSSHFHALSKPTSKHPRTHAPTCAPVPRRQAPPPLFAEQAMEVEPVLVVEPRHNAAVQRALQLNARATRTGSEVAAAPARVALPREWRVAAGSKVAWATMSDVEELRARGGNEADGRKAAVKAKFRLVVSLAYKKSEIARLLKERDFVMSKRKSRAPKCAPAAVPAPPHARQRAARLVAGTVILSWRKTPSAPSSTVARTSTRRARATESTSPSSTRLPCPTRPRRTRQCAAATATPGSTSEHSRAAAAS